MKIISKRYAFLFTVIALFVKSVKLNGEDIIHPFITYKQILNGGTLVFEMTDEMNVQGRTQ